MNSVFGCLALLGGLIFAVAVGGGVRGGLVLYAQSTIPIVMCAVPVEIATRSFGDIAGWFSMPLSLIVFQVGETPLGIANFMVLQWFGVRLTASVDTASKDLPSGHWWSRHATASMVRWSITRWVWPLTGWWS